MLPLGSLLVVVDTVLGYRPGCVDTRLEERTALQIAAHEGHTDIVEVGTASVLHPVLYCPVKRLLAAGAVSSMTDSAGDTALHYAVLGGRAEPVLALVNSGANPNTANR